MRYDHSSTVLVARVSAVPGEVFRAFRSLSTACLWCSSSSILGIQFCKRREHYFANTYFAPCQALLAHFLLWRPRPPPSRNDADHTPTRSSNFDAYRPPLALPCLREYACSFFPVAHTACVLWILCSLPSHMRWRPPAPVLPGSNEAH